MSTTGTYPVLPHVAKDAHFQSMAAYEQEYRRSIDTPDLFWAEKAREHLTWTRDFDQTCTGSFERGDVAWFTNGQLNVSSNCIDRHIQAGRGDKVAIIWEGDEPGQVRRITYAELLRETCRVANVMKAMGVKRGDTVAIYMPMIPEIAFVMMACCRLGAPHSIVFAGFSVGSCTLFQQRHWIF